MPVLAEIPLGTIATQGRWDAEYFQPAYLSIATTLDSDQNPHLGTLAHLTCSAFYPSATEYYQDNGIPFIRCVDVNNYPVIQSDQPFERLPEKFLRQHKSIRSAQSGDIIISKVGSPCFTSILDESVREAALTRTVLALKKVRTDKVNPYYLVVFLRSKYGFSQLLREREQQIQFQLTLDRVKKIRIFLPPRKLQDEIGSLIKEYGNVLTHSKNSYFSAQQMLEKELGLDKIDLSHGIGYDTCLSEVLSARRWDAQCFYPVYLRYAEAVRKHSRFDSISQLVYPPVKGVQQDDAESGDTAYASIKHVSDFEMLTDASASSIVAGSKVAKPGDLLLAITGATIGKVGIVSRYDQLAFSGDLLQLRVREGLDPHYLLVVLRSPIGQGQLLRWVTGSTNGHLAPRDVMQALIPRLGKKEQIISDKVRKALSARKQAEELLEQAKHRVEEMIEAGTGR